MKSIIATVMVALFMASTSQANEPCLKQFTKNMLRGESTTPKANLATTSVSEAAKVNGKK